jgi:hypothetical protein
MRRSISLFLVAAALVLGGCGTESERLAGDEPRNTGSGPNPAPLYEVNATVLEAGTRGPMLCLSRILESLPPQCANVPIANWGWQAVAGEERLGGTTWGATT